MVEALERKPKKEIISNSLRGIMISKRVKVVNHSQFVDDTLFLGGISLIVVERFKESLDKYTVTFMGLIKKTKSNNYGWNTPLFIPWIISQIMELALVSPWSSSHYVGISITLKQHKVEDSLPIV